MCDYDQGSIKYYKILQKKMLSLWKLRKLEGYVKESTEFGRNKSIQGSKTSFPRSLFENEKGEEGGIWYEVRGWISAKGFIVHF